MMDKPTRKKSTAVTVLRGIACVPCAILAGFLLSFVMRMCIHGWFKGNIIFELLPYPIIRVIVDFLGSIILGGVMVAIAAKVAPSGQKVVGLCFTGALGILMIFGIIGAIPDSNYMGIVQLIGIMVGAIAINIYFHEKSES